MWTYLKNIISRYFPSIMQRYSPCKPGCSANHKVYMIRHGQSEWNESNKFTGWCDVPLTDKGIEDALNAAKVIKKLDIKFDIVYTSVLSRCIDTVKIILEHNCQEDIPVYKTWRLNERHYGDLTGLNKVVIMEKYGKELVKQWRRGYDFAPPALQEDNPYYSEIVNNPIYDKGPPKHLFPATESLKDTIIRVMPYWEKCIIPTILKGKTVLICAHGNSLRGFIKILDKLSDEEITKCDVPNATPFYYIVNSNLKVVKNGSMVFLEDPEAVQRAYEFLRTSSEYKPKNMKPSDETRSPRDSKF